MSAGDDFARVRLEAVLGVGNLDDVQEANVYPATSFVQHEVYAEAYRAGLAKCGQLGAIQIAADKLGSAGQAMRAQQIIGIECGHQLLSRYLAYQMKIYETIIPGICVATTLPIFNQANLGNLPIVVPPISEQHAICQYLDEELVKSMAVGTVIERQISSLLDYRKSLIHECVTGQRRITEADIKRVKAHG